jgi:hypothetical protein
VNRAKIFATALFASIAIVVWCRFGSWIKILGFDVLRQRRRCLAADHTACAELLPCDGRRWRLDVCGPFRARVVPRLSHIHDATLGGFVQQNLLQRGTGRLVVKYTVVAIPLHQHDFLQLDVAFSVHPLRMRVGRSRHYVVVLAALLILANLILGRGDFERRVPALASRTVA